MSGEIGVFHETRYSKRDVTHFLDFLKEQVLALEYLPQLVATCLWSGYYFIASDRPTSVTRSVRQEYQGHRPCGWSKG